MLHERITVARFDLLPDIPNELKNNSEIEVALHPHFYETGSLDIGKDAMQSLQMEGILSIVKLMIEGEAPGQYKSPKNYIDQYFNSSNHLRDYFARVINSLDKIDNFQGDKEKLAYKVMVNRFGRPLFISDYARQSVSTYFLAPFEAEDLTKFEKRELKLAKSTIQIIKDSLDLGARKEIDKIREFGLKTIFPETPIASQILQESKDPKDMVKVALYLRNEYRSFRKYMIELESELLSESTSIKKKKTILKEINNLASELWPVEERNFRHEALELPAILSAAPEAILSASITDIGQLAKSILSQPIDLTLRLLRRHKVRVLLKSKKEFLKSSKWAETLAAIFRLKKEEIIRGFDDVDQWPLNLGDHVIF